MSWPKSEQANTKLEHETMTEKEGILQIQPSGRWAVCRPGRAPVEITSGELFRIEVDGELKLTQMEFRHFTGPERARISRPAWRILLG
jgi:hypothetical protein